MPGTNHQQRSDALDEKLVGSDDARMITSYAECEVWLNDEPRPRPVPVSSSNRRKRSNKKNTGQRYHFDLCLEDALSVSDVSMDDDFFEDWLSLGDLEVDQLFGEEDDHDLDQFTLLAIDMVLTIHNDVKTYSDGEDETPALIEEGDEEYQYQCNKKTRQHRSRRTVPTTEVSDDGDDEGTKDSLRLSRRKHRSKRSARKSKRSNREKKTQDETRRSNSPSERNSNLLNTEKEETGTKRRRATSSPRTV